MVNLIIQDHSSILSSISLEKESYRTCSYFLSSRLSALPPSAVHTLLSIQVTDSLRSTVASGVMGWMCSVMYQILTSAYHNDFPSINENGTFIVGNEKKKKKKKTTNKQCIFLYGRPVKTDQSAHPHSLISLHCSREEASTRVLGTHRTPSDSWVESDQRLHKLLRGPSRCKGFRKSCLIAEFCHSNAFFLYKKKNAAERHVTCDCFENAASRANDNVILTS